MEDRRIWTTERKTGKQGGMGVGSQGQKIPKRWGLKKMDSTVEEDGYGLQRGPFSS